MISDIGLGATYLGDGKCRFTVWAPFVENVEVHMVHPSERFVPMQRDERGYHQATAADARPGSLYFYRLNNQREYPDPASRFQPNDVHGPSEAVDRNFLWEDRNWSGMPLQDYIIYELHVGTFTSDGTFDSIIPHLDQLKELGITAIEPMPVAQFPGNRNWGYDCVYPFAVQNSYGGPGGLKRLVNVCHQRELAVILDVVYNHLGPEGNYLGQFGPYFTERYRTPWGPAINFDGPDSDEVRRFFIENALYWVTEFHIDALRLDAVHAILNHSPVTFLEELATAVHEQAQSLDRHIYLFPESADNDKRLVSPPELGGYGLDAQWNDDFHHSLHVLLTGEKTGYYQDYGQLQHLAKAFREGFVYSGEYSRFRRRRHGSSSHHIPAYRLVVCAQNHDQVGNRMIGERLTSLVSFEALKLAASLVVLSPFIPLLFMGEEYGETAPFSYFVSHSDPNLAEAVRKGRKEEFAGFSWAGDPPDPQDEATFSASKLNHNLRNEGQHHTLLQFYKRLLQLRKETPSLRNLSKETIEVMAYDTHNIIMVRRWSDSHQAAALFHFGKATANIRFALPKGKWHRALDSADEQWNGPGSQAPAVLHSDGEVSLALLPLSSLLFVCNKET
jgi:maltooligosyltrehalose trehalohydrolase